MPPPTMPCRPACLAPRGGGESAAPATGERGATSVHETRQATGEVESARPLLDALEQGFALIEAVRGPEGGAPDLLVREVNASFARHTGLEDAPGRTAAELLPNAHERWLAAFECVSTTGRPVRTETFEPALGRWSSVRMSLVGETGSPLVVVLLDDITARRQKQDDLEQSEARERFLLTLSDVLRPLADAGDVQAAACRELCVQLGAARACFLAAEGGSGRSLAVTHAYHAGPGDPAELPGAAGCDDPAWGPELAARLERGETVVRPDPALIAVPLRAGRRLLGAMAVLHDGPRAWTQGEAFLVELVAERAWAAVERARVEVEARRVREERDRLEREFVANAAHELRSPLAAIVAAVDALVLGAKDDPVLRERFIGHLGREAERLTRLTQSLLLLARIDDERDLPRTRVCLRDVLRAVAESVRPLAAVPVEVAAVDPALVAHTNGDLLERALANLADNAARHTVTGHVGLSARAVPGGVAVEIEDTGPGLPEGSEGRVFDRFWRGRARTADGFGLGLSIAAQVARALGATLELERRPGGGTVARVTLPVDGG